MASRGKLSWQSYRGEQRPPWYLWSPDADEETRALCARMRLSESERKQAVGYFLLLVGETLAALLAILAVVGYFRHVAALLILVPVGAAWGIGRYSLERRRVRWLRSTEWARQEQAARMGADRQP